MEIAHILVLNMLVIFFKNLKLLTFTTTSVTLTMRLILL